MRVVMAALVMALAWPAPASSASAPTQASVTITLHNHRFTPASINAPADERLQIMLVNDDAATEEFDSHDLQIEQLVTPHGRVRFTVGPLRSGRYAFMGEFHPETAQGVIIASAQHP